MPSVHIKRIYDPAVKADGFRVLVDRLWPRGIKKEEAALDAWAKNAAPSPELRKWFNHEPEKWTEFSKKYKAELKDNDAVNDLLRYAEENKILTLLYAAKDEKHNHALVLLDVVKKKLK